MDPYYFQPSSVLHGNRLPSHLITVFINACCDIVSVTATPGAPIKHCSPNLPSMLPQVILSSLGRERGERPTLCASSHTVKITAHHIVWSHHKLKSPLSTSASHPHYRIRQLSQTRRPLPSPCQEACRPRGGSKGRPLVPASHQPGREA